MQISEMIIFTKIL